MEAIAAPTPAGKSEEDGRDLLTRALTADCAITADEAARIHRAIGWPPPRTDADGAIRPPMAEELARWESIDPAIVDAMEWPELVEEIEHRAPSVAAAMLATSRETVRELRARDHGRDPVDPDTEEEDEVPPPITEAEIGEWTRVGRALVAMPDIFRRVVGVLSNLETVAAGEVDR